MRVCLPVGYWLETSVSEHRAMKQLITTFGWCCALVFVSANDCNANIMLTVGERAVDVGTGTPLLDGAFLTGPGWSSAVTNNSTRPANTADASLNPSNGQSGTDSNLGFLGSYNGNWSFNYAPLMNAVTSASISFGIWESDVAAAGDQVSMFTINGVNLTSELNTVMSDTSGGVTAGATSQYDIFTLNLPTAGDPLGLQAGGTINVNLRLVNGFAMGAVQAEQLSRGRLFNFDCDQRSRT